VVLLYGGISAGTTIGFLLFPLFRRLVSGAMGRRLSLAIAWGINLIALCGVFFLTVPMLFVVSSMLVTLTAGYIGGFVFYALAVGPTDKRYMGRFFGTSSMLLFLLQYGYNGVAPFIGNSGKLFVLCLSMSISVYALLFHLEKWMPFSLPDRSPKPQRDMQKYLWGTLFVVVILCCLMGIIDGVLTSLHAGQEINVSGIPRLLNGPTMFLLGFVFDYREARFFPAITVLSMTILIISVFLFTGPDGFNIALGFLYVCGAAGSMYSVAALTVIASSTTCPELWAIMGRAGKYLPNGLMSIIGAYLFTADSILVLAVVYVILLAIMLLLFMGQGKLSIQRTTQQTEESTQLTLADLASSYNITNRELEVLQFLLQGKATPEIAHVMSITDKSVQNYVSSLLSKTEMKSRGEMIAKFSHILLTK
ncbi:MAG: LuxR C-terminal-related transcriptional regulator, partial [Anaerovoracaceae bacterium]